MTKSQMNYHKKSYLFVKYFITPISLLFGLYLLITTIIFIPNSSETIGNVIRLNTTDGETFNPTVKYVIKNIIYEYTPSMTSSSVSLQIGDNVSILYDTGNHKEARINTFKYLWGPSILFFTIGLFIFSVSYYLNKKANSAQKQRNKKEINL